VIAAGIFRPVSPSSYFRKKEKGERGRYPYEKGTLPFILMGIGNLFAIFGNRKSTEEAVSCQSHQSGNEYHSSQVSG